MAFATKQERNPLEINVMMTWGWIVYVRNEQHCQNSNGRDDRIYCMSAFVAFYWLWQPETGQLSITMALWSENFILSPVLCLKINTNTRQKQIYTRRLWPFSSHICLCFIWAHEKKTYEQKQVINSNKIIHL